MKRNLEYTPSSILERWLMEIYAELDYRSRTERHLIIGGDEPV